VALQYDPSVGLSTRYNALASGSLAANSSTTFTADFSANCLGGFVQVWNTGGGTVAATNGCQVQAFATADTGPNYDTVAFAGTNFTIATVVSTAAAQSFLLPAGKYQIKLTNLDLSNAITVGATTATVT
jgi:hypothetical protein